MLAAQSAKCLQGPWKLMPRIELTRGIRIPRAASYTNERDAGRAIVALRWPRLRTRGSVRVFLRNVHRRNNADELRIENMREFDGLWNRLRVHTLGRTNIFIPATRMRKSRFTPWSVLKERGWVMVCEPFMLEEPMHNCMLEMSLEEFRALHEHHRVKKRSAESAHNVSLEEETATSALIRQHYEELGVTAGWTPERVTRIAHMWGVTIRELARLILCPPGRIEDYVAGQATEMQMPGSVMLWLFFMERLAIEQVFGGRPFSTPLFPQLKKAKSV